MRRAATALLMVTLVGCGLTAPGVRYFELRPLPAERRAGPMLPSILVPDFSCIAAYDHLRIVVRKSSVELGASRNLQWTTVPGQMLAQGLRSRLEGTGRFETVRREASPRPPYTVEGLVQIIELSDDKEPTARLALHLNVRRSSDGSVIGEEAPDETHSVASRDPADGIMALRDLYSHMLDGISDRIVAAIEQDVQRQAAR